MHRNGAPDIVVGNQCRPHVCFTQAVRGFHGFYATRLGDEWVVEPTPMPIARCGIAADPVTQMPTVAVDDGGFAVSVWFRDADGWSLDQTFAGQNQLVSGALTTAPDGKLHLGYWNRDDAVQYGVRDDDWEVDATGGSGRSVRVAADAGGRGQLVYWRAGDGAWLLTWAAPPAAPEVALDLGAGMLTGEAQRHALVVTGGGGADEELGTPHILVAVPREVEHDIVAVHRNGADDWTITLLAEDTTAERCRRQPMDGERCNYDYVTHSPLAAVAGRDGPVRFLISRTHHTGQHIGECQDPRRCSWRLEVDTSTSELLVAAVDGDGAVVSTVTDGFFAQVGHAVVDGAGRIHVVAYAPDDGGSVVDYLLLGP